MEELVVLMSIAMLLMSIAMVVVDSESGLLPSAELVLATLVVVL